MFGFGARKKCFADGCNRRISRKLLMCPAHWAMVPRGIQEPIYATLREWQAGGSPRPYIQAITRARLAVANVRRCEEIDAELESSLTRCLGGGKKGGML
jgi:hypothetical protein